MWFSIFGGVYDKYVWGGGLQFAGWIGGAGLLYKKRECLMTLPNIVIWFGFLQILSFQQF